MRKSLAKFSKALSALLVVYLVLSQLSVNGIVLCVGPDGHLALEGANGDSKCESILKNNSISESDHENEFFKKGSERHCISCKDIALSDSEKDKNISCHEIDIGSGIYDLHTHIDFNSLIEAKSKLQSGNKMLEHSILFPHTTVLHC